MHPDRHIGIHTYMSKSGLSYSRVCDFSGDVLVRVLVHTEFSLIHSDPLSHDKIELALSF